MDYFFLHHFHSSPKISLKNTIYNLTFKIYFSFFIVCDGYYFDPNIFITYKIFIFYFILFEELMKSSSKLLKSFQSSQYCHQTLVYASCQKNVM